MIKTYILDKIRALKAKFGDSRADPRDVASIDGWYEEAKRLLLLDNLKNHDGMKYVTEIYRGDVKKITEKLDKSYSKDLPDVERDRLLDRRDLAQKFLNLFDPVEEDLDKIEELVDKEMN